MSKGLEPGKFIHTTAVAVGLSDGQRIKRSKVKISVFRFAKGDYVHTLNEHT